MTKATLFPASPMSSSNFTTTSKLNKESAATDKLIMLSTVLDYLSRFWLCFVCVDFEYIFFSQYLVLSNLTRIFVGKFSVTSGFRIYGKTWELQVNLAYDQQVYSSNLQIRQILATKKNCSTNYDLFSIKPAVVQVIIFKEKTVSIFLVWNLFTPD